MCLVLYIPSLGDTIKTLFWFFEYGAMEMNLHRSCEQVIHAWSCKEVTGSWGLDKERHERNKLMSENTELYSY
jgi:hypothetical protein